MSTQVTTIKEILSWIDRYIIPLAAIGIGIFFLFHHFAKPPIKTPDDVVYVQGKVADYSFLPKPGQRATLERYYIWMDNYACTLQIKADYMSYFTVQDLNGISKKETVYRSPFPKDMSTICKTEKARFSSFQLTRV